MLTRRESSLAYVLLLLANQAVAEDLPTRSTCQGFIGVMEVAARTKDPLGPTAYINLANSMFQAANHTAVTHRMPALPLPGDDESQMQRQILVIAECQRSMNLSYADAVINVYMKLRVLAGFPQMVPRP